MEFVKLGKSGQVSIPRAFLRELGAEPGSLFVAEVGDSGEIVLRLAGVYPIEIYSDERLAEFAAEDRLAPNERKKLRTKRSRA